VPNTINIDRSIQIPHFLFGFRHSDVRLAWVCRAWSFIPANLFREITLDHSATRGKSTLGCLFLLERHTSQATADTPQVRQKSETLAIQA